MRLRTRLEVELFSPGELERLAAAAIRLWAELPLRVQGTDELFDHLSAYGCRVDRERVYFPPAVREKVLTRIRAEKQGWLEATAGGDPGWPGGEIEVYTHGQALLSLRP